jgi:hypothetical protein
MVTKTQDKQIYIVISQTGSILSRILKLITGADYNHVSLGLNSDLKYLYSFGRKNPSFPLPGGFVIESPDFGTFKRFYNTKVLVLALNVDAQKYNAIDKKIKNMLDNKQNYSYNYLGLCLAIFKINKSFNRRYYCSEFVKYILECFKVDGFESLSDFPKPMHFLNIPDTKLIYDGKLKDYESFYSSQKSLTSI